MSAVEKGRWMRMSAFRWGVLAGVAPALLFVGVIKPWLGLYPPLYNVTVATSGVDVSRHGGVRVIVEDGQGPVADQACREGCDDLQVQAHSGENTYRVRVLDGAGACAACGGWEYVTNDYGAGGANITVSGADALSVRTNPGGDTP